jgi:hypothetical protein
MLTKFKQVLVLGPVQGRQPDVREPDVREPGVACHQNPICQGADNRFTRAARHGFKPWWGGLLVLILVKGCILAPLTATAQQIRQATIREILDGKQVFIQDRQAQENDVSTEGQVVRTIAARAGLLFDVDAGIRLGQNSSLTVGSECIQLIQGQVMVAGTVGRNGCVGTLEVRSLSTVYIMQLDAQNQALVVVLEGSVEVFSTQNPDVKVTVGAGQGVTTAADGTLATTVTGDVAVNQLSQSQLETIAAPLVEGFQVPLPNLERVAFLQQRNRGFRPTFLQDALLGREGSFEYFDGQRGQSSASIRILQSTTGTFIRDGETSGVFIPDDSPAAVVPISVDFDANTISIGGTEGIANSVGLSGNGASGTVVLKNGQVIRVEVFDVGKKEPGIGVPFRGRLINGTIRDR